MTEIEHYDYDLPRHLIAQQPVSSRADARMLVVDRARQTLEHHHVRDLPDWLRTGDCLVLNDTRVVPARLVGRRNRTAGRWVGLFLEAAAGGLWRIVCKARGKLAAGEVITLLDAAGRDDITLQLGVKEPDGSWIARPSSPEQPLTILDRVGRVPLPHYIRKGEMDDADREHYQTVFARLPGAIAAPTAGLHFTQHLLSRLKEQGVDICPLTLHVGRGTFRPVNCQLLSEHRLDAEWGMITEESVARISECRQRGGRVVAVGTTSVRLLETAAGGGALRPFTGYTDLFIRPSHCFQAVDALLTNFHLPRTTLLVLVRAFGGDKLIARAYAEAIREGYRFYSYGDAMLIV
jgi:S-adenosylmethionine:tRNA ribosyltransferase-isomerase